MSKIALSPNASGTGTFTVAAPNTNTDYTLTLPQGTGTVVANGVNGSIVSGTAQASTSGTSIDFTGIPSWVKRITVMFSGVSTNGTDNIRFQLMVGGSAVTTNYTTASFGITNAVAASVGAALTSGWNLTVASASSVQQGQIIINKLSSSVWTGSGQFYDSTSTQRITISVGRVTSVGTVDGLRVTTTSGTNTFDAGSINILYE